MERKYYTPKPPVFILFSRIDAKNAAGYFWHFEELGLCGNYKVSSKLMTLEDLCTQARMIIVSSITLYHAVFLSIFFPQE